MQISDIIVSIKRSIQNREKHLSAEIEAGKVPQFFEVAKLKGIRLKNRMGINE